MKQMQRLIIVFALLITLGGLLAACGGGDDATPEATAAPVVEATAVPPTAVPPTAVPPTAVPPTETAVPPTNTPEPTAVPAPSFDELTNEDFGVTISYPAGWVTEVGDDGSLGLASDEKMLANTDDFIQDGMIVRMMNLPADAMAFLVTEGDPSDPVAVLNAFSGLFTEMSSADETISFTPRDAATAATIAGYDAATAVYDVQANEKDGVVKLAMVSDLDNNRFLLIFGGTLLDKEAENLPIFDDMLQTLALSTPAIALEPTGTTGTTEVTVPGETEGFLLPGDTVENSLEDEDGDSWSYIGLEDEVIDIIVEPVGDLDLMVDIVDEEGNSIIGGAQDASFGIETIEGLTFPAAGSYIIIVSGFDGATGDYSLTVAEAGAGSSGSTGGVAPEGDLTIGEPAEGSLEGDETAVWTFGALEGEFVDVLVTPLNDDFDVVIDVVDEDGNPITDSPTDASYNAELIPVVTIPADGLYGVTVTSFDGTAGDYEVLVRYTNDGQTNSLFFTTDSIEEADEEHNFPFNALKGDIATFIVEPSETDFDVVVSVYNDDTDELIEERDASKGIEALTFEVSESGNYYFNVKSFEGSLGNYDTALIGSETVIFELASGDELFGQFGEGALQQYYLGGESGDTFTINVEPDADTDVVLRITDLEGNVITELDDAFSGEAEELEFTFGDEGLVIIEVVDFWEALGTFTMTID